MEGRPTVEHKDRTAELQPLICVSYTGTFVLCFVYDTWGNSDFSLLWSNYKKSNKTYGPTGLGIKLRLKTASPLSKE